MIFSKTLHTEIFNSGEEIKKIVSQLAHIIINIELLNPHGIDDINRFAESFFAGLFCRVYNKNFENINLEKYNYPAIDLICHEDKKAIQVTSNDSAPKIQKTKDLFKNSDYKTYKLQMFFLKRKYSDTKQKNNKDIEIKYIEDLIREIIGLDIKKQKEICEYMSEHMNIAVPEPIIDLTEFNNPKKPKNIDKFLELEYKGNLDDETSEYYLNKIYNYIEKLRTVDFFSLRYYGLIAKRMFDLRERKSMVSRKSPSNLPNSIIISAFEDSIQVPEYKNITKILKTLENYDLILLGENMDYEPDVTFCGISSEDGYDSFLNCFVYKLLEFAHKLKIDSDDFFVKLDFSSMEKKREVKCS